MSGRNDSLLSKVSLALKPSEFLLGMWGRAGYSRNIMAGGQDCSHGRTLRMWPDVTGKGLALTFGCGSSEWRSKEVPSKYLAPLPIRMLRSVLPASGLLEALDRSTWHIAGRHPRTVGWMPACLESRGVPEYPGGPDGIPRPSRGVAGEETYAGTQDRGPPQPCCLSQRPLTGFCCAEVCT